MNVWTNNYGLTACEYISSLSTSCSIQLSYRLRSMYLSIHLSVYLVYLQYFNTSRSNLNLNITQGRVSRQQKHYFNYKYCMLTLTNTLSWQVPTALMFTVSYGLVRPTQEGQGSTPQRSTQQRNLLARSEDYCTDQNNPSNAIDQRFDGLLNKFSMNRCLEPQLNLKHHMACITVLWRVMPWQIQTGCPNKAGNQTCLLTSEHTLALFWPGDVKQDLLTTG